MAMMMRAGKRTGLSALINLKQLFGSFILQLFITWISGG